MIDVIIKKNNDTYVCIFRGVGWSYAECVIYKKTKLLGFIPWKSYQYASSSGFGWGSALRDRVEKAKPEELIKWAHNVFDEFWEYKQAWDKHNEHI